MTRENEEQLRQELLQLRQEHRELDAAIAEVTAGGMGDTFQVQRMKKRKLMLKDRIAVIEDRLLPDIIA